MVPFRQNTSEANISLELGRLRATMQSTCTKCTCIFVSKKKSQKAHLTAAANTSAADAVPLSTNIVRGGPCALGPFTNVLRASTEPFFRMMKTTSCSSGGHQTATAVQHVDALIKFGSVFPGKNGSGAITLVASEKLGGFSPMDDLYMYQENENVRNSTSPYCRVPSSINS